MLQEHLHGRLTALQTHHDVGELRGHLAQRGSGLLGRQAHIVQAAGGYALGGFGFLEVCQVGGQRRQVSTFDGGHFFKVGGIACAARFQFSIKALNLPDHGRGDAVELLGCGRCLVANPAHCSRRLSSRLLHASGHALRAGLDLVENGRGFILRANNQIRVRIGSFSHVLPIEKPPP